MVPVEPKGSRPTTCRFHVARGGGVFGFGSAVQRSFPLHPNRTYLLQCALGPRRWPSSALSPAYLHFISCYMIPSCLRQRRPDPYPYDIVRSLHLVFVCHISRLANVAPTIPFHHHHHHQHHPVSCATCREPVSVCVLYRKCTSLPAKCAGKAWSGPGRFPQLLSSQIIWALHFRLMPACVNMRVRPARLSGKDARAADD